MRIICSWHSGLIGEKEPYGDRSETHTICPDCARKYFHEYFDAEDAQYCNDSMA